MIKRIFDFLGYIPKQKFLETQEKISDLIEELNLTLDSLDNLKKTILKTESKNQATIKKLNKNNIRLLKRQGEYKETIKSLRDKLNERP